MKTAIMPMFKDSAYLNERNADGTLKHVVKSGARFHVVSWSQKDGVRCSEPNCEMNRPR